MNFNDKKRQYNNPCGRQKKDKEKTIRWHKVRKEGVYVSKKLDVFFRNKKSVNLCPSCKHDKICRIKPKGNKAIWCAWYIGK